MSDNERSLKVLTSARDLIEKGWIQEADAINDQGRPVPPSHPMAVAFCIVGACCREYEAWLVKYELNLLQATLARRGTLATLPSFNDTTGRTKDEVLALFDETIAHFKGNT